MYRGCCRLLSVGPAIALGLSFALTYSAVWFGWISDVATHVVAHGPVELVMFLLEVFLLLASYFTCVVGGPGATPPGWAPTEAELAEHFGPWQGRELPLEVKELSAKDLLQFCHHCNCFKPPRSHHCSQCRQCVPAMDHHCPWTNTCVGAGNLKAFFLFVFYTPIACAHCAIVHFRFIVGVWMHLNERSRQTGYRWYYGDLLDVHCVLAGISMVAALVVTGLLSVLCWEMSSAIRLNFMDLEELLMESAAKRRIKRGQEELCFPYNLGSKNNWQQVFGPKRKLWFLPSLAHGEDAIWTPIRPDCGHFDIPAEQVAMQADRLRPLRLVDVKLAYQSGRCSWFWCWCCLARRLGSSMCSLPPVCDPHLNAQPGDRISVAIWAHGWAFGSLLVADQDEASGPRSGRKGWLPRGCLDESTCRTHAVPCQSELQGMWDTSADRRVHVVGMVAFVEGSLIPCVLRSVDDKTELQGCELRSCDGKAAHWSNGDVWLRVPNAEPVGKGAAAEVKKVL